MLGGFKGEPFSNCEQEKITDYLRRAISCCMRVLFGQDPRLGIREVVLVLPSNLSTQFHRTNTEAAMLSGPVAPLQDDEPDESALGEPPFSIQSLSFERDEDLPQKWGFRNK